MTEHSVNFRHLTATAWVASYGSTNNHDSLRDALISVSHWKRRVAPSDSRTGRLFTITSLGRYRVDFTKGHGLHRGRSHCSEPTCCKMGVHYSTVLSD